MSEAEVDPQLKLVEHIYWLGRSLWSMAIRRSDGRECERMYRPRVGDLVFERTSFAGFDPDGVGHLLRIEGDDFVIEPLLRPGEECRWANAEFVALPEGMKVMDWAKADEEES
ncbi:hypothetical protein [Nocardia aurea]|jgi:hypothetical protein|uniref:hypothetical protein n=1 Tax=Nocardia aurea TaxID=2144174 RepID=UPI0033BA69A1